MVIPERIEIDYVDFRGPAFENWDRRSLLVHLVSAGLADAVFLPSTGSPVPRSEVLHKKAVVLAPGYFGHSDSAHSQIHLRLLASGIQELRSEHPETSSTTVGFFCLTASPFTPNEPTPKISDLLSRIEGLLEAGGDVLLFRQRELYHMTTLVNRHTKAPVRFVTGLSLTIRAFEDLYGNLEGRRLEALARLFAQNVRIYVYPMTVKDLQEWLKNFSTSDWEWSDTNGWVSANQLRRSPPLGYLFSYLLASNFLVPMQVPEDPAMSVVDRISA